MDAREPEIHYGDKVDNLLIKCCREATLDMIKEMALHDELVVTADLDGAPIWVKAREILQKNPTRELENINYTPIDVNIDEILNSKLKYE